MSGTEYPDAPPPEVPEEFAAAYRDAYRRALEADASPAEGLSVDLPEVPPQEVVLVGTHRSGHEPAPTPLVSRWRATRWFLPAVIAASALVLVVAAYAVGMAFSGDDEPGAVRPSAAHTTPPDGSGSPSSKPSHAEPSTVPGSFDGPVNAVSVDAISADCTAPASNDSSGKRVTYVPENAIDGKVPTAWRCSGTAVGQKLTLRLAGDTDVAEVGLIPGYAKTDPESGTDRYAENNRITKVRWTLGDGESFVQRLDPDPASRAVQLLRVPRTTTDTVTLEILGVHRGPRNTTAISEVALYAAA
jgi:hypothetical protein